ILAIMGAGLLSLPLFKMLNSQKQESLVSRSVKPTELKLFDNLSEHSVLEKQDLRPFPGENDKTDLRKTWQPKEIETEIARIETELGESLAIERLNNGLVGPEERAAIGEKLINLDQLREQDLKYQLLEIEREVALLASKQAERLQKY